MWKSVCAQVFHIDGIVHCAEQMASGRKFPKFNGDDEHQVCKNFVLWSFSFTSSLLTRYTFVSLVVIIVIINVEKFIVHVLQK